MPTRTTHSTTCTLYVYEWEETCSNKMIVIVAFALVPILLLLLVRLHDQSSSSDEVGGLLQVLQAPI